MQLTNSILVASRNFVTIRATFVNNKAMNFCVLVWAYRTKLISNELPIWKYGSNRNSTEYRGKTINK